MKRTYYSTALTVAVVAYLAFAWLPSVPSYYRITTAMKGVATLLSLPRADIDKCIKAYEFMVNGTSDIAARAGDVDVETDHVRAYYAVANEVLAIADIEKMPVAKSVAT